MGLDQYLVTDGARIPVGVIDRGFCLIYEGKEWRDRYLLVLAKSYVIRMALFGIGRKDIQMVESEAS